MRVIRSNETRLFMDGPEVCRKYVTTEKIAFGTSTLLPGQTGATDPGHPEGHEIFYCSRGHVVVYNRDNDTHYELKEGDILLIEEGEPHQISNIGMEVAVVAWSCAPRE